MGPQGHRQEWLVEKGCLPSGAALPKLVARLVLQPPPHPSLTNHIPRETVKLIVPPRLEEQALCLVGSSRTSRNQERPCRGHRTAAGGNRKEGRLEYLIVEYTVF